MLSKAALPAIATIAACASLTADAGAKWTTPARLPLAASDLAINDRDDLAITGLLAPDQVGVVLRRPHRRQHVLRVPAANGHLDMLGGADIGPQGELAAAWSYDDGTDPADEGGGASCCHRVCARTRSAAGRWGPRRMLSTPHRDAELEAVLFDASRVAHVLWNEQGRLGAALARPGRAFRRLQTLTRYDLASAAVNGGPGAAGVGFAWVEASGEDEKTVRTAFAPNGGPFGPARPILEVHDDAPYFTDGEVGIGPDGGQTIASVDPLGERRERLSVAVAPPGGRAGKPVVLRVAPSDRIFADAVVRASGGRGLLVWQEGSRLLAAFGTGTAFGPPTILQTSRGIDRPEAWLDERGRAIVAWIVSRGEHRGQVRAAVAPRWGKFGGPADVTPMTDLPDGLVLAANTHGLAALTWNQANGGRLATYRFG